MLSEYMLHGGLYTVFCYPDIYIILTRHLIIHGNVYPAS